MEFKEWFCLNNRDSFTIDPKVHPTDARFYFGRAEIKNRIQNQVRRAFVDPGTPKMFIYGPFGSGKTQTLFYLEHLLQTSISLPKKLEVRSIHLDLEMRSKSDFGDWHLQLMEKLGKETVTQWVEELSKRGPNLEAELRGIFRDLNMVQTTRNLLLGGEAGFTAWRWLCGQSLPTRELEQLKVTRNLGQIGSGDMVNVLVGVGRLAEANGQKLVFFMDEAEQFKNVRVGDAAESLHDYVRKLAESSNSATGFVIAGTAVTVDDMPELLVRPDVRTRIGEINIIEIPHLPAMTEVETFLKELLAKLVEMEKAEKKIQKESLGVTIDTYPLTTAAFDLLCEFASADPIKCLPRNVIKALNECCIAAWDDNKAIVDDSIVNDIAPIIFG